MVGGYVLSGNMDGPVIYLDTEGRTIATFHIFGTDNEKARAAAVIEPLTARYPKKRTIDCK